MGVAGKRALGQQTDAALRRGVRSCFAQIAQEANASRNAAKSAAASTRAAADASRPTILGESRKDLAKGVRRMQGLATVTKEAKTYRQDTQNKDHERSEGGLRMGCGEGGPSIGLW